MDNRCVICGEIIPEGRMVCPSCEKGCEMLKIDISENVGAIKTKAYKRGFQNGMNTGFNLGMEQMYEQVIDVIHKMISDGDYRATDALWKIKELKPDD